jgi:hypothetical protein
MPRKILAASQIFSEDGSSVADKTNNQSQSLSADTSIAPADRSLPNELPASPKRTRRATVMGLSPSGKIKSNLEVDTTGSPSKRQGKSKSQSNLLAQPITPLRKLEMELERCTLISKKKHSLTDEGCSGRSKSSSAALRCR